MKFYAPASSLVSKISWRRCALMHGCMVPLVYGLVYFLAVYCSLEYLATGQCLSHQEAHQSNEMRVNLGHGLLCPALIK